MRGRKGREEGNWGYPRGKKGVGFLSVHIRDKKSLTVLHRASAGISPGGVGGL